jgi:[protein-PII] uridylyltransferase
MLYVFTYLDIRSVGPGIWTAWKGAQLAELYQKTRIQLENGSLPEPDPEEMLNVAGVAEPERGRILEHCRLIDHLAYERETVLERMLDHMRMIDAFKSSGSQVEHQELPGFSQVTFCNQDRAHLFADLTGLLLSEGLNILGARIYSRLDGIVLDLFQVTPSDDLRIEMSRRVENLRAKLARIEAQRAPVTDFLAQRRRFQVRGAKRPLLPPTVRIYNDLSAAYTAIEIHAGDRPGLLYDLTVALADLGLDVKTAKVSTMIDRARDVFFVLDGEGGRITAAQDVSRIERALSEAARWPGREGGQRLSSTLLSQESKE